MNGIVLEQFLVACGSKIPLRLGLKKAHEPPERWTCRAFRQPFLIVGRDPNADLVLDHWQISRRHLYLQLIGARLLCVDLDSRTGLSWDEGSWPAGWLDAGQVVRLGDMELRLWDDLQNSKPEVSSWIAAQPGPLRSQTIQAEAILPGVRIVSPTSESEGSSHQWPMDRIVALAGRGEACRLRLGGSDISRFECSLVRTPNGLWVVDLLGRNGVLVNGIRVRCARLEGDDEVRLGRYAFRPQFDQAPIADSPGRLWMPIGGDSAAHRVGGSSDSEQKALDPPVVSGGELSRLAPPSTASPALSQQVLPAELWAGGAGIDQRILMQSLMGQMGLMHQLFDQFHQAMSLMFQMFHASQREQMDIIRQELEEVRKLTGELQRLQGRVSELETIKTPVEAAAIPAPANMPTPPVPSCLPLGSDPDSARQQADMHYELWDRISRLQTERQGRWQRILGLLSGPGTMGSVGPAPSSPT